MTPLTITTTLANEEDAQRLASIMTAGFAASDAAYPLVWGSAPEGTHDTVAVKGLFTPVQKEGRVTFKAVDETGKIVGFATWNLPKEKVPEKAGDGKKGGGLPPLPGVNIGLWEDKSSGPKEFYYRDVDPTKDILLSFFFVDPEYQRQGIGSLLLEWGIKKAGELQAKTWITSTPQAVSTYERNGWKVVDRHDVSLEKYGVWGFGFIYRLGNIDKNIEYGVDRTSDK